MTLADWADIAGIVGVILVVASLTFLAMQIRQSTMQQRLEGKTKGIETQVLLFARMTDTLEKSDLMRRALNDFNSLTVAERGPAQTLFHELTLAHNGLRHAYDEGLLDKGEFASLRHNWLCFIRTRGARIWYENTKHMTPPDFQAYVASIIDDPRIEGDPLNETLPWLFGVGEAGEAPLREPPPSPLKAKS
jgi:hypothetical protein